MNTYFTFIIIIVIGSIFIHNPYLGHLQIITTSNIKGFRYFSTPTLKHGKKMMGIINQEMVLNIH